jgi:dTDP-4-amino-4,6-dideoxygalactose transaminase
MKAKEQISNFIPYCMHTIENDEIQEVVDTLKSNWLTSGHKTIDFENQFANYIGSKYAIAVSSCTAALHLALSVCGIKDGDEVITTPLTFAATTEVIEYQNAKPIFVDVDPSSFNINVDLIEEKISSRTRAILPVHYGGIPCDLNTIYQIANRHDLFVIEDAAHAVGTVYQNRKVGSFGNPTAFSFYPTKNITTAEGGVITTNDEAMADKMKILSLHGISKDAWKRYTSQGQWYYEIHELGYKYNFTDIQAALGLHQLKKLDQFNSVRERYARLYFEEFCLIPAIQMPDWYHLYFDKDRFPGIKNSWHLFVIQLEEKRLTIDRSQFIEELKARGVGSSVHFIPLHLQPYYAKKYGFKRGDFKATETIYDKIVSLPLYPKMTEEQLYYIIDTIKDIVRLFNC